MIDELNAAISVYMREWEQLVKARKDSDFFAAFQPTAVGWKTSDLADYEAKFAELRDHCDKIFCTWMNDRWVAKLHVRDQKLASGVTIIKLMQRRPGSSDPVGLDHLDFTNANMRSLQDLRAQEPDLDLEEEVNGLASWVSLRFAAGEAKLRSDTVLQVVIAELEETDRDIYTQR